MSTTKNRIPLRTLQNSMNIPLVTDNVVGKGKVRKRTIILLFCKQYVSSSTYARARTWDRVHYYSVLFTTW